MKRMILLFLLILNYGVFAETIILNSPKGTKKTLEVNSDSEKLVVNKEMYAISSIEGLEKLVNLKNVEIYFSDLSSLNDSTWESLKKIQSLKLVFCSIKDFLFLKNLTELKVFSFSEGIKIEDTHCIDFKSNPNLYFFEIHASRINDFPNFINVPKSMKYVYLNFKVENEFDINKSLEELKCRKIKLYIDKTYLGYLDKKLLRKTISNAEYLMVIKEVGL